LWGSESTSLRRGRGCLEDILFSIKKAQRELEIGKALFYHRGASTNRIMQFPEVVRVRDFGKLCDVLQFSDQEC
jgi:hypothetical protein